MATTTPSTRNVQPTLLICTPGIAVCAAYVVDRGTLPTDEAAARAQVRELLAGNICRCTGYQLIVDAVIAAARDVT